MRGTLAPLKEYAQCAAERGGLVIVDDTQALGILGRRSQHVYGTGGGGSVRYFSLRDPGIVVVSSLAKAFGAPVAMLGGSLAFLERFRRHSGTVVHCSPPSAAAVTAALRALWINRRCGDVLRERLAARVIQFRRALPNVVATKSRFPVQTIHVPRGMEARDLFQALARDGIRAVLHRDTGAVARISFVLTARHRKNDVERAADSVSCALARNAGARPSLRFGVND
jgi:8-amino-7-oxononanoate synthase